MPKRILVIGLGRFGSALAESLAENGCEVIAVDSDMTTVDELKRTVTHAVELDATNPQALRSIEAASCAVAVIAIGESFEASALTVAALREVGVAQIVARARTPRHARILIAAGASHVIELETQMGKAIGDRLARADAQGIGAALSVIG